jgi:GMP synthase-like glutamine amidotransferase
MKPIRIFRHEDWIQPGRLTEYLASREVPWNLVCIDRGEQIPQRVDDVSGLVFLGGTMSVNDEHCWLAEEMRLIRMASALKVPMLGHCLGSQLIAKALGGTVTPMPNKEIGWHEVRKLNNPQAREWLRDVPERFQIFIWHHEAFSLPPGAEPLYSSDYCPEQAFVVGNTMATIAHAEITAEMLEAWLDIYGYDIESSSPSVQPIEQIRTDHVERCSTMHRRFTDRLYDVWMTRVMARMLITT